jgi:two-component system sensor histidine kinase RegB
MATAQPIEQRRLTPADDFDPTAPVDWDATVERRGRLRLRTLVTLRWLAVVGQTIAVGVTALFLGFEIPLGWCLGVIALSAWLNVLLSFAMPGRRLAQDWEAAAQLGFDVIQLAILLGLTGGLANPFSLLLIAPPTVAAATLPTRHALAVSALALAAATILAVISLPLPWTAGALFEQPQLYQVGVWIGTMVGIVFTAGYAWQAAAEASRMELALAATQAVLAREQRLSALGGLAAAAAHELGTPLATIQVVAKELLRSSPPEDPVAEDARLLLQQAQRCRDILRSLSQRPDTGDIVHARLGFAQMLNEVVDPYRGQGPTIVTKVDGPQGDFVPDLRRLPETIHALASFVENAVDFAAGTVTVQGRFDDEMLSVEVRDDGAGIAPEILVKLGEPYVTSRPSGEGSRLNHEGMGLGFFIAKTLLERSGASVTFGNDRKGGAVILTKWPRKLIEAPDEPLDT